MVPSTLDMEPSTLDKKIYSNISVKSVLNFFLRHFLLYGGSSTEQKTFLGSHSYSKTCYQVTCSASPPPFLPTQQVELIWMEMSTSHLFFQFFLFVFHFSKKKKIKKLLPSTLGMVPSTLDPRLKNRLLLCEYYIQCSPYMHNMLLRRHMRNKGM